MPGPQFNYQDINQGWNPNANWLNQTDDRLTSWMTTLPQEALANWGQVAQGGIYGDNGIDYIMRGAGGEQARRRKSLQNLIRRRYSRRLGSRAGGAAESTFANEVLAPMFAEDVATRRGLRQRNLESRAEALKQRDAITDMLAQMWTSRMYRQPEQGETWGEIIRGIGEMVPG